MGKKNHPFYLFQEKIQKIQKAINRRLPIMESNDIYEKITFFEEKVTKYGKFWNVEKKDKFFPEKGLFLFLEIYVKYFFFTYFSKISCFVFFSNFFEFF